MSRANSLKKAIRWIIEQTETGLYSISLIIIIFTAALFFVTYSRLKTV